ncbi:PD-(D/E)XK motif protein [Lentzea sp. NPDC005914]|uniref:PD-(D/E)XK motif protein n=1 Tax=Lentzea sp. NPDC005914 TaxID=3154572 RepID=UPI00340675CD
MDPEVPEFGLRIHDTGDERLPDLALQHVKTRSASRGGHRCLEVVITLAWVFPDSYPLLCAIADRVQLDGMRPAEAVRKSLGQLTLLLRRTESLTEEREVGLFGEMLTLGGLIALAGATHAVRAWRGGLAEEHDFGLPGFDVEVKTTRSERRQHWIESLTQLVGTGDRPLWLVSHQITAAGDGTGSTLSQLIDRMRRLIGPSSALDAFETGLAGSGWIDDLRSQSETRWTKRFRSQAYLVDEAFPRLTAETAVAKGADIARIPEVRYLIDLDGMPADDQPPPEIKASTDFEGRS